MTLAGVPAATLFAGISCITVEPNPMIQLSPIDTPLSTVQFLEKIDIVANSHFAR